MSTSTGRRIASAWVAIGVVFAGLAGLSGTALAAATGSSDGSVWASAQVGTSSFVDGPYTADHAKDWSGFASAEATDDPWLADASSDLAYDDDYVGKDFRAVTVSGMATVNVYGDTSKPAQADSYSIYEVEFVLPTAQRYVLYGSLDASGNEVGGVEVQLDLTGPTPTSYDAKRLPSGTDDSLTIGEKGVLDAGAYRMTVRSDATANAPTDESGDATGTFQVRLVVGCQNAYTAGADLIRGTSRADILCGGGGADTIFAGGGPDIVLGGGGPDIIYGGGGVDDLRGQAGDDRIDGGPASDRLDGGGGGDTLLACDGVSDQVLGRSGFDTARRDKALDTVTGVERVRGC